MGLTLYHAVPRSRLAAVGRYGLVPSAGRGPSLATTPADVMRGPSDVLLAIDLSVFAGLVSSTYDGRLRAALASAPVPPSKIRVRAHGRSVPVADYVRAETAVTRARRADHGGSADRSKR